MVSQTAKDKTATMNIDSTTYYGSLESGYSLTKPDSIIDSMKFVGSKYHATEGMDVAELAKLVRADIRTAIKNGELPRTARDYSVTIQRYSGGRSLNVTMKDADHLRVWTWTGYGWVYGLTDEGKRIESVLTEIVQSYNYDDSDIMTDYFHVRFYSHVKIDYDYSKVPPEPVGTPYDKVGSL